MLIFKKNKSEMIMNELDDTYLILGISGNKQDAGSIHQKLQEKFNIVSENPEKINGVTTNKNEMVIALKEKLSPELENEVISYLSEL